jgi:hypothetical protein
MHASGSFQPNGSLYNINYGSLNSSAAHGLQKRGTDASARPRNFTAGMLIALCKDRDDEYAAPLHAAGHATVFLPVLSFKINVDVAREVRTRDKLPACRCGRRAADVKV